MKSRHRIAQGRLLATRMREVLRRKAQHEKEVIVSKKRKIRRSLRVHNRLLKYRKFGKNWLIWRRRYKRLNLRITFQAEKLHEFIALYQGAKNGKIIAENEAGFWKSELEKLRNCINEEIAERDCKIENLRLENEALKNEAGNLRKWNEKLQNELKNLNKHMIKLQPQTPDGPTQSHQSQTPAVAPTYLLLPPGYQISASAAATQPSNAPPPSTVEKLEKEIEDLKKRLDKSYQANFDAEDTIRALKLRVRSFENVWNEMVAFKPTLMQALQKGLSQILKDSESKHVSGRSLTALELPNMKVEVYKSSAENGNEIVTMRAEDGGKIVYRDPVFIGFSEQLTAGELRKCLHRMARLNQKAMFLEVQNTKMKKTPNLECLTNWFTKYMTSVKESGDLSRAGRCKRLGWFSDLFCTFTKNDQQFAVKTIRYIERKMGFSLPDHGTKMTVEQDLKLKIKTNLSWHKREKMKCILLSYGCDVFAPTARVRDLAFRQQTGAEGSVQNEETAHTDNWLEEDDDISVDDDQDKADDSPLSDCSEEHSELNPDHQLAENDDEAMLTDDVNTAGGSGSQHLKEDNQSGELFFEETLDAQQGREERLG